MELSLNKAATMQRRIKDLEHEQKIKKKYVIGKR